MPVAAAGLLAAEILRLSLSALIHPLVSELFPAFCCAVHQLVSPVMEMESELVL